jgi:hypothetical protein
MIRKLAAVGDSFSTTKYGRSWPHVQSMSMDMRL